MDNSTFALFDTLGPPRTNSAILITISNNFKKISILNKKTCICRIKNTFCNVFYSYISTNIAAQLCLLYLKNTFKFSGI